MIILFSLIKAKAVESLMGSTNGFDPLSGPADIETSGDDVDAHSVKSLSVQSFRKKSSVNSGKEEEVNHLVSLGFI